MELDKEDLGPAMQACSERERRFVDALLNQSDQLNFAEAARAAGVKGTENAIKVTGHRLSRRPKVQAAILEEAQARKGALPLLAISSLAKVAADPKHKDHVKACLSIMNRVGMHEVKESVVHHKSELSYKDLVSELRQISSRIDMPLPKWLTDAVDAEFTEVPGSQAQLPKPDDGRDGLEDLL